MPHCNKKMLSFFLTTKCNLCCVYCYNAKERNSIQEQTISLKVARAAVDWYFENNSSRHIRFYGPGEPTQEYYKMKKITQYAKNHPNRGNDVTVELQTNGVFTKEVRNWLLNNANIVWMSFDGMKDIQNKNRPLNPKYNHVFEGKSSADVLEDNVRWLIEHGKDKKVMIGARVTINNINCNKQIEMVDYFYDLGIRYVWTDPLFYSVGKKPVCDDPIKQSHFSFDMKEYVNNYVKAYNYANKKGLFWGSFLTINFDGESAFHCRCCHPLSAPHITPDGYISACDMVVLGEKAFHMSPFIVGKWNECENKFDWFSDKIRKLNNRSSLNMSHCKDCIAKLHCGGYCLGEIVNETGKLDGYDNVKCTAIRYLLKELGLCQPYNYLHP